MGEEELKPRSKDFIKVFTKFNGKDSIFPVNTNQWGTLKDEWL